ncbi:MAG: hypothetical protein A2176_12405 [Spirochaetes bacterium RBG_13_51_14]|nr:MAG: hypothetical protein A2176_12405 [Spirochaetes bacterium RBG_13_51_14]
MFRTKGSDVDIIVTGYNHPYYIEPPKPCTFYDPPTDPDAASDSESLAVRIFSRMAYEKKPTHFPADEWIVRASLAILERKKPDFGVILLAQMDDAQHGLGAIGSLAEFKEKWHLFTGTVDESRYNPDVWKGPIVDAVRDVDIQFGRLIDGLRKIPYYRDATSFGMAHFRRKTIEARMERAQEAKRILQSHRVRDKFTGAQVSPWHVLDMREMKSGVPGVCSPGELFHPLFGTNNRRGMPHWPDLFIFMKDGWQLPITSKMVHNIGAELPRFLPTTYIFYGGHGAPDTDDIVIAIGGAGIPKGKIISDPQFRRNHRISDIAATVSAQYGLGLRGLTAGKDRSTDM